MSLGLDTSVVVRLLMGAPAEQAAQARRRLERAADDGELVIVTDLVVAEAYYALHYHYDIPKQAARDILRRFADSGVVQLAPPGALAALTFEGGAGLVDRLIHARHRDRGGVTLTFDRKQSKLEGAVQLG